MSNLYGYVYGILMFVILITLIEMLLPKGNNKKYVKLVSSFLLTIIVLTPIINVFANQDSIKNKIEEQFSKLEIPNEDSIEAVNQQVYIDNLFEEGIKNDISKLVNNNGYDTENIEVEYNKNEEGQFSNITKISFNIVSKIDEKKVENIEKVNINLDEKFIEIDNKNIINDIDKNKIKQEISDRYKIDKSYIYIY